MKTNSWERARGARTRDDTEARVPGVQFLGNGSTSCVPYLFMYFEIPSIHHASETWLAPPSPPPRSALPRQPQPFLRLLSPFLLPPFSLSFFRSLGHNLVIPFLRCMYIYVGLESGLRRWAFDGFSLELAIVVIQRRVY